MKFIPPSDLLEFGREKTKIGLYGAVLNWLKIYANHFEPKLKKITNPNDMVAGEFYIFTDIEQNSTTSTLYIMYLYKIETEIFSHIENKEKFYFAYTPINHLDIGISNDELEYWKWTYGGGFDSYSDTWSHILDWAQVYKLDFGYIEFNKFINWNDNPLNLK